MALQDAAVPGPLHDLGEAVTADVHEAGEIAVVVPQSDDGNVAHRDRQVVPRVLQVLDTTYVLPAALEDAASLELVDLGVVVPARGKRPSRLEIGAQLIGLIDLHMGSPSRDELWEGPRPYCYLRTVADNGRPGSGYSGRWQTASTLLPSGSRTKAP